MESSGMRRTSKLAVIAGLVAGLIACWGFSNAQAQVVETSASEHALPPFQLKVESNLVTVPVVVRDAHGDPVKGLQRQDFRLFDQGKEQSITHFEEESSTGDSTGPVPIGAEQTSTQPPATRENFVALYFDDLDISAADMIQARDAADRYLATGPGVADRVAIFTTSTMLSDFTSDPKQIHNALFQLRPSSRALDHVSECPALSDYQALEITRSNNTNTDAWKQALAEQSACGGSPLSSNATQAAVSDQTMAAIRDQALNIVGQVEIQVRSNLQQLERVVKYVSHMPGQRRVILVSTGFLSSDEQLQVNRIIDNALRAQVVIHSLDPKGLAVLMEEADASHGSLIAKQMRGSTNNLTQAREFVTGDVLAELAQGTGGTFFHNQNDLKSGFSSLAGHPELYTLAFAPKDFKEDGKFHSLKVELVTKEKGYSVQARRGYIAAGNQAAPMEQASLPKEQPGITKQAGPAAAPDPRAVERDRIREVIRSNTEIAELPIQLVVKPPASQEQAQGPSLLTHLDVSSLHFHKEGDLNKNTVTFIVGVFDQKDNPVQFQQRHTDISLLDGQLRDFFKAGLNVEVTLQLKLGTYRLREVVTDSEDHRIAATSRDTTIP